MIVLPLIALAWLLTTSGGQGTGAPEHRLTSYPLVLLKRGPGAGAPDDGGRIQAAHIARLESVRGCGFGIPPCLSALESGLCRNDASKAQGRMPLG